MDQMELEKRAKERSTLLTKTTFRFIACAYLIYEGYDRMIKRHLENPAEYPRSAMIFGIFFIIMAIVYGIYAALVYRRGVAKKKEREAEGGTENGAENAAAGDDESGRDHLPGD